MRITKKFRSKIYRSSIVKVSQLTSADGTFAQWAEIDVFHMTYFFRPFPADFLRKSGFFKRDFWKINIQTTVFFGRGQSTVTTF